MFRGNQEGEKDEEGRGDRGEERFLKGDEGWEKLKVNVTSFFSLPFKVEIILKTDVFCKLLDSNLLKQGGKKGRIWWEITLQF